jgi:hypothetical protein
LFPQHSELCEHIDGVVEPHREYLYKKYGVPDADALKAYLKVVYEPSYKDRWG